MNKPIVESRFRLDPDLRFDRPELTDLAALWEEKRGRRATPDRTDFSAFALRPYLPRVLIYDVVTDDATRRFRIRVYGTLISEYSGRDRTGKFVDETMTAAAYVDFYRGLSWVVEQKRPLRAVGNYSFVDRSFLEFESITMPLTAGGSEIEQLLNITYYADEA